MSNNLQNSALQPLSEEELNELKELLLADSLSDEAMLMSTLDGYLTAIASAPVRLNPSEWMPGIWGPTKEDMPTFATTEQAEHTIKLIIRHLNGIINILNKSPEDLEPILDKTEHQSKVYIDGEMWAYGYMAGVELCHDQWQPIFDDADGVKSMLPICLLGGGANIPIKELVELVRTPEQREEFSMQIPACVLQIRCFWLSYTKDLPAKRGTVNTIHRDQLKIGRNDPCSCGSGKKFKRCCG